MALVNRRGFLAASAGAALAARPLGAAVPDEPAATDSMLDPGGLIAVKPHAQLMGEREMGIVWMTSREAEGWVEWSQDGGQTWLRAWDERDGLLVDACDRMHKIVVSGYDPAKPFRYRVKSRAFSSFGPYKVVREEAVAMCEGEMNAVLPPDGSISFAMFNDVHNRLEVYPALARHRTGPLSFTVFNGDIMNHIEDEPGVARCLMAPLAYMTARTRAPMWYLRGNHETRGRFARHLRDYVALPRGRYYGAVSLGGARFVFVDTGEDKEDSHPEYSGLVDFDRYVAAQTAWLAREVASEAWRKATARVVFMHIPPDATCADGRVWRQPLARIRELHAVLNGSGVSLVMGAHLHRWACDPANEARPYPLIIGGGPNLAAANPAARPTLAHCTIKGTSLTATILSAAGETLASLTV